MIRAIAFAGVSCISFAAILVRLIDAAPATITFFRALYALPVLAVAWWAGRARDLRPGRARRIAFAAGLFLAADLTLWHISIEYIGAGLATVLANIQVVFVGLIAWITYRERPSRTALVMVPAVFGGVVLISGLGGADAYGARPWAGVGLGVAAGFLYALFILTLRASNRGHLAPSAGPVLDATAGTACGGFVLGVAVTGDIDFTPSWPEHGWLLVLALLVQALGWLLITYALPRLAALETSVLILAQPVLAIIWAYLIFAEDLSPVQWTGVTLVLGGLLLLTARGSIVPAAPPPAEEAVRP